MTELTTLRHPGPAAAERIVSVPTRARVVRRELAPGELVTEGLWRLLEDAGGRSGSAEISSGELDHLPYVFPAVSHRPDRAATFSETHIAQGETALMLGAATIGHRDGERFAHVHATWVDRSGVVRGGHVLEGARVGRVPVNVVLRAYDDVELHSAEDAETLLPTFSPHTSTGAVRGVRPADVVVSRVRPGVDLVEAVRRICVGAGWDRAIVHSSLGSTVGARFHHDGEVLEVTGPAVEFTKLVGVATDVLSDRPDIRLSGTCVDIEAHVHSGTVIAAENAVAVTFELVVERSDA